MDAKPSGQRQTPNSFLAYAFSAEQPRKRKRSVGDDGEAVLADDAEDRPKPRRVNPHHLAARLGPDLVREMEVHIRPGAYMPSFAIRKDLQERYSVDRRHLYDYFHSRGLRVAKEERFNNLARSRQKKAQEKAVDGSQSTTAKFAPPPRKRQTISKRQPFSQISTNVIKKESSPAIKVKEESPDDRIPDKKPPQLLPHRINTASALTGPGQATISTLFARKEPKLEFSTPQDLSALQPTLVADSFSPSDMTINPRDIFLPAGAMPDPHLLSPYNVIEDPESPYLPSFADLDGVLPLTYAYEASLILPLTVGICPEKEDPSLYDLVHQSAMPLSAGTCGSYEEYMANRRNSYYDGLLTGYEDCRASAPSHALHDAFNDFDGWLVDDHPISQVVSSASTAPSISPSPRITPIIPPGKPTPCFQFLHPSSLAVSQTALQRPRVPPSRIRRCSMSNFAMSRMRTVSAGGCF